MFRIYLFLFCAAMFFSMIGGAYWYYKDTQERLGVLRENNAKLEVANQTNQETINRLNEDMERQAELNQNLTRRLQESQVHLDALRTRLSEIDLTVEALQDPEGMEERVNNAVEKLISRIESETSPAVDPYDDTDSMRDNGTEGGDSD